MEEIKTFANWNVNLDEYLKIGDLVDAEMVDYFINVLPPACMNGECIQMGEPCNHRPDSNGVWRATYSTLKKTPEGWRYAGQCFRGRTENVE